MPKTAKSSEPETSVQNAEVLGGVVPYLSIDGAMKAAEFYERALGGKIIAAQPVDEKGRTLHVHLHLNGGSLMLSDFYPEHGHAPERAAGYTLHLKVENIDEHWTRAVDAGCEIVLPLQLMFWGDRYGQFKDPFGVLWSMGEPQS